MWTVLEPKRPIFWEWKFHSALSNLGLPHTPSNENSIVRYPTSDFHILLVPQRDDGISLWLSSWMKLMEMMMTMMISGLLPRRLNVPRRWKRDAESPPIWWANWRQSRPGLLTARESAKVGAVGIKLHIVRRDGCRQCISSTPVLPQ